MKTAAKYLLWIGILAALATPAFAESRTISWSAVTTYTDGTLIESGKTVGYLVYWSTTAGGTLTQIGTSVTTPSMTFDPDVQRMPRSTTIYFTVKAVLESQESALSTAYAWFVPAVTPPAATLSSIAIGSGPTSVNEGGTGTYTATATWSDTTTTSITPTWSVSPTTYASISSSGVLKTLSVTSNQTATVTASYTSGGVTKTATRTVTIANVAATLSSIAIGSGPTSVNEGGTGTYTATATWSDTTTTSITPTWSVSPTTCASISSSGVLTALSVTSNQTATVTASYTSGGVTKTATRSVTIVDVAATLTGIVVSGPTSVNEGGNGTYTATATWSDSTTTSITPTWSVSPTTYASIGSSGVLATLMVTSNQTATVTASYTSGGVTKTATRSVTIVDVAATLTGIAMIGPTSVNEGGNGTYTATSTWSDTTTTSITPTWSVSPTTYASIGSGGVLTALQVTSNQTATVTASYTSGGVTKTATQNVTIANVAAKAPAAPKNFGISGPISSVPTEIWRLHWDTVTTNSDSTPIDSGRTVRYTAYWTDDPALSTGSLRPLGSSISGTTLEFDPSASQMAKNNEVYLTVRAVLDTGEQSSLAAGIPWRVSNEGPIPPERGKIYKK